ncbi:MAG: hypothetical protein WCF93_02535 [Candidatus Moraniibacteriota bacterium]
MVKNYSNISKTIDKEAKKLDLTINKFNTLPLKSFYVNSSSKFGLSGKNGDLYRISLLYIPNSPQSPGGDWVTIDCGRSIEQYDNFYNAINIKPHNINQQPHSYDDDSVWISRISSDNKVYFVYRNDDNPDRFTYYYFDENKAEIISQNGGSLIECSIFESRKIGKGMQCEDNNIRVNGRSKIRFATY